MTQCAEHNFSVSVAPLLVESVLLFDLGSWVRENTKNMKKGRFLDQQWFGCGIDGIDQIHTFLGNNMMTPQSDSVLCK